MYDYLIYSQLKKFAGANKAFHMPGHKARGEFKKKFPVADIDVTELSYSDNLACPETVIKRAQEEIAALLGASASFILTDGSSSGVMTMLYAASKRGNKVIVPRNCHQSVWNACALLGLEPLIVQGETVNGVIGAPSADTVERLIVNDVTIAGLIVTSPDYYGNIAPLEGYAELLKRHSRLLMVDGAHGAHLAFENAKSGYAGVYADIWVDGAHKSLATLTQGAILNVKDKTLLPDVKDGLSIFRTTSPSYPIMASVEYGVKSLANSPALVNKARAAVEIIRSDKKIATYSSGDWTKIVVDCEPYNVSADEVAKTLENKGIYCEFSDGRYIVFYASPYITAGDIKALKSQLKSALNNKKLAGTYSPRPLIPAAPRTYSFQYALKHPYEWVDLDAAIGRMCASNAGPTPPCIPAVVAGELVTEATVKILKNGNTFGLSGGKIRVVKK